MDQYKLYIDGKFVEAVNGKTFPTMDPGSLEVIAEVSQAGSIDAELAIEAARRAFDKGEWSKMPVQARMAKIQNFADQIARQALRLASTESINAGQVIGLAKFMPFLCISLLRNLSQAAATKFPWEEEIPVSGNAYATGREFIRREPIGVCACIVPWNYPLYIAMWKLAPALCAGNTVVLKPATLTPLTACILAECAQAAGIPDGVLNIIPGPGWEIGQVLCTHPGVDKVALTGSMEVGRDIMKLAADTVKKVSLELGGKSANIILDDADIDLALEGACFGTFLHQGQVCSSGTRVLVHAKIYDQFVEKMKERAEKLRVGYQLDPTSQVGPIISKPQSNIVGKYVRIGRQGGAELITGGKFVDVPGMAGLFYAPTIFANVKNKMRIAQEEIFGPVVCVTKFDSDEEAIAIANDSIYGLAGGVFSSNTARAQRIAEGVRTGTMWINNYHIFSDFCPFGGFKQSGVGRDFGMESLYQYTLMKRIHINSMANYHSNMYFQILSDYKKMDCFSYDCPTKVVCGHGCLPAISKSVVDLGCKRALILTAPEVKEAGLAELAKNALAEFYVGTFDNIPADPDLETVDAATEMARALKADCIVSVGGGNVIDTAKGVCVALKNGGKANDYLSSMVLTGPQTPHIAIPTTSGSGSEVTNVAALASHSADRKLFIVDPRIIPNVAILDPLFTLGLSKSLTVTSAMDAMTHAVEAMTSTMSNLISDGMALQAIRLISENLPLVVEDGKNEKVRINLQVAATMAGWASTVAQVGLAHGMAHTVGSLHHVPHDAACGIMLPKVMRYNAETCADKLAQVAKALGVNTQGMSDQDAALASADAIEALMQKVGHPMRLRDMGVPEDELAVCALHAAADTAAIFNGRPVKDPYDIIQLFDQVY